jgi:two-component system cell cycle sensor histidine kinase/response regulator CckA
VHTVNGQSRNQPATPRRPIVLRPPESSTEAQTDALFASNDDPQTRLLRDEISKLHQTLEQWSSAEGEWSHQRRLFEVMTENVSDLIVLLDPQGNRTWNNPAYSHSVGYTPQELSGTFAMTEVHADDKQRAIDALTETLQKGATTQSEYRVQQKDGDWISLQTENVPILDAAGRVETVVLLAHDVTEKRKLEESLALASTSASAAGLVEGMARDFDQILTNVVGNLTIAKNLNGPHNAIAVRLNEMERALQRARDLIEQMFSIAPHEGAPKVRTALEPAVQQAVGEVLRGTMVRAEFLFPRNLPMIDIDEEAFSHAIRNIVTNSVQAMDKGVVRFSAESIPQSQFSYRPDLPLKAGDYLCLHIQDQGHGISEKALPRVFEPYFTTRSGSQGLGLTTALSTIQRMGGTILLESTPGVGTTISVYVPVATGEAPTGVPGAFRVARPKTGSIGLTPVASSTAAAGSAPRMTSTGGLVKPSPKRRILLMDDEQMILDIVSRMLGHLGYEVTTCTDGSQAIAAFTKAKSQNEPFDVVMMDLVIPNGVGGQDAVHTIKKIDPNAKVIASSGHLEHPVMRDHKNFGFNAVLEKPYKLEKLQQVIENAINAPAA